MAMAGAHRRASFKIINCNIHAFSCSATPTGNAGVTRSNVRRPHVNLPFNIDRPLACNAPVGSNFPPWQNRAITEPVRLSKLTAAA